MGGPHNLQKEYKERSKRREDAFKDELTVVGNNQKKIESLTATHHLTLLQDEAEYNTSLNKLKLEALKVEQVQKIETEETLRTNVIKTETNVLKTEAQVGITTKNDTPESIAAEVAILTEAKIEAENAAYELEKASKVGQDAELELLEQKHQGNLSRIEVEATELRIKKGKEAKEAKLAEMHEIETGITNLTAIVGKQTAAGKVLASATSLINTYQGATEVLRAKSVLPEPFGTVQKLLSVGSIISTGIKAVKAINSVKVPGAGSTSTPAPIKPELPIAATTSVDQNQSNNQGNSAMRAFVIESDVSGNQERIRRLNRAARINTIIVFMLCYGVLCSVY